MTARKTFTALNGLGALAATPTLALAQAEPNSPAALGAVLGSQVSGHGARTEGSVIGGMGGALVGGAVGDGSVKCGPSPSLQQERAEAGYPPDNGYADAYRDERAPAAPSAGDAYRGDQDRDAQDRDADRNDADRDGADQGYHDERQNDGDADP